MKRVMCVYLPHWPLQRLWYLWPELRTRPLAIVQPSPGRGSKVLCCCERAARAGVRAGMPVAEARAIQPLLVLHDHDPPSDRLALQQLAAWSERYSPIVGLEEGDAPESLLLDITGCAACFHGEDRLAERVANDFRQQGWTVRVAIADTLGAAWGEAKYGNSDEWRVTNGRGEWRVASGEKSPAVARFPDRATAADRKVSKAWVVCESWHGQETMPQLKETVPPQAFSRHSPLATRHSSLPLAALRLPEEALEMLAGLGIESIGQLLELPRESLPGRFGPLVLRRLDQMLGQVPEVIVPYRHRPEVQARCSFEYATDRRTFLEHALEQLLERIVKVLEEHQRGAKHLECWFYHEVADPCCIDVRLYRPSHEPAHLKKMLLDRWERLRLAEPVRGICLRVALAETLSARQVELFDADEPPAEELAALIDRLVSRLGREAVTFPRLVADPQPEYACRFEPALGARARQLAKALPLDGGGVGGGESTRLPSVYPPHPNPPPPGGRV